LLTLVACARISLPSGSPIAIVHQRISRINIEVNLAANVGDADTPP
jgi:hypothetical protein